MQAAELAVAVPQVVAHRVTRMALAGAQPSARDRKEFKRMVDEKTAAFGQSWAAMAQQAWHTQHTFGAAMLRAWWAPWLGGTAAAPSAAAAAAAAAQWQRGVLGVLGKGLAPVHRKATANAKRLRRTKLR